MASKVHVARNPERARRQAELVLEYRRTRSSAAFQELLASVDGLIGMTIRRYAWSGISTEDLAAEATVGVLQAIERFDPEAGPFFAAATTAIRRVIDDAARRSRAVAVSYSRREKLLHVHGASLYADCLDAGLPASVACDVVGESFGFSSTHVAEAMSLRTAGGAERLYYDDEDRQIAANVGACGLEAADVADAVDELLGELPSEERAIIERRLLRDEPMTYIAIGAELGISRELASAREARGMAKLRGIVERRGMQLADLI